MLQSVEPRHNYISGFIYNSVLGVDIHGELLPMYMTI